jgi:hypothetical protein
MSINDYNTWEGFVMSVILALKTGKPVLITNAVSVEMVRLSNDLTEHGPEHGLDGFEYCLHEEDGVRGWEFTRLTQYVDPCTKEELENSPLGKSLNAQYNNVVRLFNTYRQFHDDVLDILMHSPAILKDSEYTHEVAIKKILDKIEKV